MIHVILSKPRINTFKDENIFSGFDMNRLRNILKIPLFPMETSISSQTLLKN